MDLLQLIVLALIQGITEFLPISSSAHLILPKELFGWPDQGLAFDVAVHVGSLAAVLIYFRRDVWRLTSAWFRSIAAREPSDDSRLGWYIIAATIPAGLAALAFGDIIEDHLRSATVIMLTTVIFGLYLGWADYRGRKTLDLSRMTLGIALLIGLAQALALIPGTSRSGITIAAALALGMQRESAARFSFLLSIPIIVLSGLYTGMKLLDESRIPWGDIALGALLSGISAYVCIHFFLSFIQRIGMMPFVIYRLFLGAVLGLMLWAG
ncbi:undecaprenyl-diphosphate phosphatase [Gilvimarinus sp. F26214L]|uniref:undecaprenyl-diphosphate phosphatase n=1 Tax=Gilvimarinus sp. DZF01 TaxID=3461371 RepID=UPI004045B0A1